MSYTFNSTSRDRLCAQFPPPPIVGFALCPKSKPLLSLGKCSSSHPEWEQLQGEQGHLDELGEAYLGLTGVAKNWNRLLRAINRAKRPETKAMAASAAGGLQESLQLEWKVWGCSGNSLPEKGLHGSQFPTLGNQAHGKCLSAVTQGTKWLTFYLQKFCLYMETDMLKDAYRNSLGN